MTRQTSTQYRTLEKLGSGVSGVVYRVFDECLDHFVALKFSPDEVNKDSQVVPIILH